MSGTAARTRPEKTIHTRQSGNANGERERVRPVAARRGLSLGGGHGGRRAPARALSATADTGRALAGGAEAGPAYLRGRGLAHRTCQQFGLGYTADASGRGPAIAMPWYWVGKLSAILCRLPALASVTGPKVVSEPGSRFAGLLFGGQALLAFVGLPVGDGQRLAEALRTLALCEGEINAMSIWQEAKQTC